MHLAHYKSFKYRIGLSKIDKEDHDFELGPKKT